MTAETAAATAATPTSPIPPEIATLQQQQAAAPQQQHTSTGAPVQVTLLPPDVNGVNNAEKIDIIAALNREEGVLVAAANFLESVTVLEADLANHPKLAEHLKHHCKLLFEADRPKDTDLVATLESLAKLNDGAALTADDAHRIHHAAKTMDKIAKLASNIAYWAQDHEQDFTPLPPSLVDALGKGAAISNNIHGVSEYLAHVLHEKKFTEALKPFAKEEHKAEHHDAKHEGHEAKGAHHEKAEHHEAAAAHPPGTALHSVTATQVGPAVQQAHTVHHAAPAFPAEANVNAATTAAHGQPVTIGSQTFTPKAPHNIAAAPPVSLMERATQTPATPTGLGA